VLRMKFFVVGLSHKTAPVELREQLGARDKRYLEGGDS
jgi:glutamyl-tRNA reductase